MVPVSALAFSPDGKLLAAGLAGKAAYVWSLADKHLVTNITDHGDWVQTVAFSSNGKLFATGVSNGLFTTAFDFGAGVFDGPPLRASPGANARR